jgi:hypothetical protein
MAEGRLRTEPGGLQVPLPDRVLEYINQIETLLDQIRTEMQEAVPDPADVDVDQIDEITLRRARFLRAFVEAGGELTKDQTHAAAGDAGYPDMRGIAGWYNGVNATLRQRQDGSSELTGAGWEYWRTLRTYLD